jgi:hypothetical protein
MIASAVLPIVGEIVAFLDASIRHGYYIPGLTNIGRMPDSGLSAHFLMIANSASRFDSMYLLGTTGRKASAAEM